MAQRAAQVKVEVFKRLAEAAAARFVVPGDDEWPGGLDDLRHAEPIQRRGGEPFGLWLRGPGHLAHLMERSVAVVGSRAATAYGNGIAADLAADLVEQGVTVLSGGAFGIDVAAHRGALAAGGPTVCVLANGVDVAYPPGHASIFETLAKDQLLVSELPPAAHPTRVRFLIRNRLIAAMSRGTVVVEAALRSGARNTAGWALACGRPPMAVPGPVYSRASTAPHLMIRNGQAVLVTSARRDSRADLRYGPGDTAARPRPGQSDRQLDPEPARSPRSHPGSPPRHRPVTSHSLQASVFQLRPRTP